jgi:acyl-CoA dehydrogenase
MTHPLIAAAKRIATEISAPAAADVDTRARFPHESVAAMREARLLSAAVPTELGGGGLNLRELGEMCALLAQGCGSSGMVLAMHHIQVACIARHALQSEFFREYLRSLSREQWLLASITSEVGTSGDTRSSIAAVERHGDRFVLNKDATTGSYCAHADAILVTCRRDADAPRNDQVLVLVRREDASLQQTTTWDTMGMRGTCSPGFRLESSGPVEQIVPGPYADSAAQSMVPYSHTLWAALWSGIAADAAARAGTFVRAEARRKPGEVPATAPMLVRVSRDLQALRSQWQAVAAEFDALGDSPAALDALLSFPWALKFNNLKMAASEAAPQIVHQALQITGILGYKNDSPFSLSRQYRDTLSASLMISNERIAAKSAPMLLVLKDD